MMKKALITVLLLVVSFTFFQTSVSAAISSSFDASLLESISGLRKNKDVKILSTFKTTYKTGDTINAKWTLGGPEFITTDAGIINVRGRTKYAVTSYFDSTSDKQITFDITDDIPSGEYVFLILRSDERYDISKVFKIQTKTKPLPDDKFIDLSSQDSPTSKEKATNAALKATFSNTRAQAELYYDSNGGYSNICKKELADNGIKYIFEYAKGHGGKKADCDSSASAWSAEVLLVGDEGYYCVDSTGVAKVQSKSKGSKATGCDGSIDKTKKSVSKTTYTENRSAGLFIGKIRNLKSKYASESVVKFSVRIEDAKGKPFSVSDGTFHVYAWTVKNDNNPNYVSTDLGYATYNAKEKIYDFNVVMPSETGKYSIHIDTFCSGATSNSECTKVMGYEPPYTDVDVEIVRKRNSSSRSSTSNTSSKSLIKIISPNGGEKITDTGSIKFTYSIPTGDIYFTQFFIMPSTDTKFTLTNPTDGIRGYQVGGTGSRYVNYTSVFSSPWSIGPMPVGKYKLRGYLYKYRDGVNYSVSEALDMDESDEYFIIDTSNSNQY